MIHHHLLLKFSANSSLLVTASVPNLVVVCCLSDRLPIQHKFFSLSARIGCYPGAGIILSSIAILCPELA